MSADGQVRTIELQDETRSVDSLVLMPASGSLPKDKNIRLCSYVANPFSKNRN